MRVKVLLLPALLLFGVGGPARAQEPKPARVRASQVAGSEGLVLRFAWRYAPGDAAGREVPGHDDSTWQVVLPALSDGAPPGWPGIGWFRRHLLVEPALQGSALALRLETPGAAEVFLDGRLVLSAGRGQSPPELPSPRRESSLVTLPGRHHVLAVRYVFPVGVPASGDGIGFQLSLAVPGRDPAAGVEPGWLNGLRGAIVALPAFLAFLHLALYAFDRRARENVFYAIEMAAFALVVLREYRENLLATVAQRETLDALIQGIPVLAILFGLLTYYAVRTMPYPRTWRLFAGSGLFLLVASYVLPPIAGYAWIPFFAAVVVEVLRIEGSGRTIDRRGAGIFLASFAVLLLTIVLQVLIVVGVLESVAGTRAVYAFGIVASAVGMSLYLARSFGEARVVAAESERKGRELERARELQLSMLPRVLPRVAGLDVAAATHTAAEVGGDFYDLRSEGDGSILVAFGDATGHGLAPGILVTVAKALFTAMPAGRTLPELLAECGRVLSAMSLQRLKMCLALARVSPCDVAFASAAMPPLLVHRAGTGAVEELGAGGLPLGGRLAGRYEERRTSLGPGDTLLFASDGLAELRSADGGELGYDGAARAFSEAASGANACDVVDALGAAIARARALRPLEDDVTFVVVRVTHGSAHPTHPAR